MSVFAVTIERIAKVWEHTNADRLAMAQVASMTFQFVIGKDSFQIGDPVVYFPIDSLLPPPIITALGLEGKLAGTDHNRIKTVRLRGEISQGVVARPQLLLPNWDSQPLAEGEDVTAQLGVVKYEPPAIGSHAGKLTRLPAMVSVYDIEGAERFAAPVQRLMNTPVVITEKLEGSHFAISIDDAGEIAVSQRRYRIEPIDGIEHDWHRAARKGGLIDKMPALKAAVDAQIGGVSQLVTLRGEMIGVSIQGNYYKLPHQQVKLFEIEVNGIPLDAETFLALSDQFALDIVPVLVRDVPLAVWLNGRTLADASNGETVLKAGLLREGIVIRPMHEQRDDVLGRLIIKQRSPQYLAGSEY
jgi:RNA ligase (TIGR02306 family)